MNPQHPLFSVLNGQPMAQPTQQQPAYSGIPFENPMQRAQSFMQAMQNPAAFVRQNLPQIPSEMFNDPTGKSVLQYMMTNMGVTQQDIQNAAGQMPNNQFLKR